jgi:hypothetical protein
MLKNIWSWWELNPRPLEFTKKNLSTTSKNKNKVWGFNLYKIKLFCASIMSY